MPISATFRRISSDASGSASILLLTEPEVMKEAMVLSGMVLTVCGPINSST